jgi:hypothetical protein
LQGANANWDLSEGVGINAPSAPHSDNGAFTFDAPINYNGAYAVLVSTQPTGQVCTVGNATGSGVTADVNNLDVSCSATTLTVGGTVSGLAGGTSVALSDNGTDPLTITVNGPFTFATPINYNGDYAISITAQPTGQVCAVGAGADTGMTGDVTNVDVACMSLIHFTPSQITDSQWDVDACTTTSTCVIFSDTPGTFYTVDGQFDWVADDNYLGRPTTTILAG